MSKWMMNKVGLVDFCYYDEQEFTFADGRMLLRGSNGSGKSVTMQSFIPLILDGNMRPERLDPFGSRARKMDNYLLEEDDGREERTGYLYMEFRRMESETYTTIGIGLRARRNKPLQSWYFCITDGRRIGIDFALYKDVQNKIPYTKTELRNRIAEGGAVFETQNEYMQCVNNLIFNFESIEEYKELINLLIQLRTPKLSKDFKPSIIHDILSQSLQPLSEEDLRPMSEAIENMDMLRSNLANLADSFKAAGQIEKSYRQYNQLLLYEKALGYRKSCEAYQSREKEIKELEETIASEEREREEKQENYLALGREQELLQKEYDSLKDSDAARLKSRAVVLEQEMAENRQDIEGIGVQLERKKEDHIEKSGQMQKLTEEGESCRDAIGESLDAMIEQVEGLAFDETAFLRAELEEELDREYDFSYHTRMLKDYRSHIRKGVQVLREEKKLLDRYDEMLAEMDAKKRVREERERQLRAYERQLEEQKGELTEAVYSWERENQQFHMAPEPMQEIVRLIHHYHHGDDYSEIRDILYREKNRQEDILRGQAAETEQILLPLRGERDRLKETIRQLEAQREPEPERTEAVRRNRERLTELGIPFQPFYKMVDFDDKTPQEVRDRLEGALQHMGILDALIVGEEYREQVLSLDGEGCDRYLFGDAGEMGRNLLDIMHIEQADQDIVLNLLVSNIVSSIGFGDDGISHATKVNARGWYQIGILEGNVESGHRSSFIGAAARERYKKEKLDALQGELDTLTEKIAAHTGELERIRGCQNRLKEELAAFPREEDMKLAAKEFFDQQTLFDQAREEIRRYLEKMEKVQADLREVQVRVQEICAPAHLDIRLEIFEEAEEALYEYERQYQNLQREHGIYLSKCLMIRTLEGDLEALDQDMDDLRYRDGQVRNLLSKNETELQSINRQLALTDYDKVKERLDFCIDRLHHIPRLRERLSGEMGELRKSAEQHRERETAAAETLLREREIRDFREKLFRKEFELDYVEKTFSVSEQWPEMAERICAALASEVKNKDRTERMGNLQEAFHQYKGILNEYQPMLYTQFEELAGEGREIGEEGAARLDIKAKYRGNPISFLELIRRLETDMEELSHVLSEKDRELFEDILSNTISKKIRARIYESRRWVKKMNDLMESMDTSSGLKLNLRWISKKSEKEDQLDTKELVDLLLRDTEILRQEDIDKMAAHFRSRITEARNIMEEDDKQQSFFVIMREILDYRQWFEFQLYCQKTGEKKRELTDRIFFTFSGGEKAMSMYVPLFSAVVAKYSGASADAPRIISLDEAFAGVDEMNIKDMFRLMVIFEFNYMMNSQVLWGDYETVPSLAIYQLLRPDNAKFVTVIPYWWNGKERILQDSPDGEDRG